MNLSVTIKNEYSLKEQEIAQFMAFLCDSALYFDDSSEKYLLLNKDKINEQIKEAYKKGDYLKANCILKSAKMILPSQIERMSKEVTVRSLPLTFEKYIAIVYEALQRGVSPHDIMRWKLCDIFKQIIDNLSSNTIRRQKLDLVRKSLKKWRSWPTSKLETPFFSWDWEVYLSPTFRETFCQYIKIKLASELKRKNLPRQLIEFIIDHIKYETEDPFLWSESMTKKDDSIFFQMELWGVFWFTEYSAILEKIKEQGWKVQNKIEEYIVDSYSLDESDTASMNQSLYPSIALKVNVEKDHILFEGVRPSNENREKLEKIVFAKLCPSSIQNINIDRIKKRSEKALENGSFSQAYELNNLLSGYKATQDVSRHIVEKVVSDLSFLHPVTLTIPKILSLMLDAYKTYVYNNLGIKEE
ncbi:hypothetical protein J7M02_03695 [Candidatus Aerophobetes bacterium]|nr:hypothetical protein [Candidatus Aerophobetes bacterium]